MNEAAAASGAWKRPGLAVCPTSLRFGGDNDTRVTVTGGGATGEARSTDATPPAPLHVLTSDRFIRHEVKDTSSSHIDVTTPSWDCCWSRF